MRGSHRRRTAFSLIELTVVILILGIVAAVAQPRYAAALAAFRLDSAAQRVAQDLQWASTRARVSSKPVLIRFHDDAPEAFYRFDKLADPLNPAAAMNPADSSTWYTVDLTQEPYAVWLSANADLTFDIHGRCDQDALIVLSLGAESRTVRWNAASGELIIE
ncbi:pilus assembly FimT family protein [Roseimaritima ulvae]|uniref:General secretion pathway GspH domain-containing protein n=1 Tax=Roseimaritima ulvae TaxID=980254 RepID=A0A5B9QWQ7_9BACT|nr:prepilin-type N-terminal cleavage/methylation domain-containing protein [Roseimaritima ulvae]QEG43474.1 hypothetical protein UC8_55240 [Roseimaritima ulvae]